MWLVYNRQPVKQFAWYGYMDMHVWIDSNLSIICHVMPTTAFHIREATHNNVPEYILPVDTVSAPAHYWQVVASSNYRRLQPLLVTLIAHQYWSQQSRPGPFHERIFFLNSNPMKISSCCASSCTELIAVKFCICHDSCDVVACTMFCGDTIIYNKVTLKPMFHWI